MDFKNLATKKIAKSAILLSPGQSSNVGYKVISGCLKSYVIDNSGKEHILQFAPEGWFISDLENFTKQTPSQIFIDAVEDSVVELFTRYGLEGGRSSRTARTVSGRARIR